MGKRGIRFQEVRMGNLPAVEEEGNTNGRKILARWRRNNVTTGVM